jgi:uncharacterized protein YndB with AHSA1/START domain
MPLQTTRTIEIGAPPHEVFTWLVEADKLTAWSDATSQLPADSSALHLGWQTKGSFPAPDGPRAFEFEITAYAPPHELAYVDTYAGGKATASYRLTETADGTHLETAMSADTAAAPTAVPDAVKAQIESLPEGQRQMAEQQIAAAMQQMQGYDAASNPAVVEAWGAKIDAELSKLKELVELVQKERSA